MNKLIAIIIIMGLIMNFSYGQETDYKIFIMSGANENSSTDFPFDFSYGVIVLQSSVKDTSIVRVDENDIKLSIKKINQKIFFHYSYKNTSIEGEFTIPSCRLSSYIIEIDPETFGDVIKIEEYYVPYRSGVWKYNENGKTYEVIQKSIFKGKCE